MNVIEAEIRVEFNMNEWNKMLKDGFESAYHRITGEYPEDEDKSLKVSEFVFAEVDSNCIKVIADTLSEDEVDRMVWDAIENTLYDILNMRKEEVNRSDFASEEDLQNYLESSKDGGAVCYELDNGTFLLFHLSANNRPSAKSYIWLDRFREG